MGILLTASPSASVITTWIIAFCIIGAGIFYVYKKLTDTKNQKELDEFLNSLKDTLMKEIVEFTNSFDFEHATSTDLTTLETTFFNDLYNDLWDIVQKEIDKLQTTDDISYRILKKVITKDKLKSYVEILYAEDDTKAKIEKLLNTVVAARLQASVDKDKALAEESDKFEDGSIDTSDVKVEDLDPTTVDGKAPTDEIIPPKDEVEIEDNDPTVEVISEEPIVDEEDKE